MKIGISDMYLDALGGGEKYMLSIASALSRDNQVEVFWGDKEILQKAQRRFSLDLSKITVTPPLFSNTTLSALEKAKRSAEYDMIIHLSDGSIPLSFAKEMVLHFQHPINWLSSLSLVEKLKLRFIKHIICNSEYTKKSIDKTFGVKSTVLHPPAQSIGVKGKKENIILSIGRVNILPQGGDFKKLGEMIELFKELEDMHKTSWKLVLVITYKDAEKEYVSLLKEQAKGYPIVFSTDLSNEELKEAYQKAKIYWHAAGYKENLENNPERAEHFGITIVEAMSAGAVPVVIKAGGVGEIISLGENGYLWKSKEELFSQTIMLMKDDATWKELSKKAIVAAEKFSHESFEKHVRELLL